MFRTMQWVHTTMCVAVVMMCVMLLPTVAWAQGTAGLAGVAKDDTGAVLPGVTVEAASPVLIEKVRTVVTDAQGQYKIVSLLPGTYAVTFTLTGFTTAKREGVELASNFTGNVDAVMKVGALEETIIVSGQTPVVDVQNVVQSKVISREILFALPINRENGGFAAITPGAVISATQQDVGGNKDPISQSASIHGSRSGDTRVLMEGMRFNAEGSGRGFYFNPASAAEISLELGGNSAEYELGGVQVNLIPKDGGNIVTGFFTANYTNKHLSNDNLNNEIIHRGLKVVNSVKWIRDANGALGGPIKKDKLWFFTAHRSWGYANFIAGNYYNKTQGSLFYTADLDRRAFIDETNHTHSIRFTWQASQRNKFTFSYDIQNTCLCHVGLTALVAPEAAAVRYYKDPNYVLQSKWTNTRSNKLLLEASGLTLLFDWPNHREPGVAADTISILEQSKNYRYGTAVFSSLGHRIADQSNQRFAVSYVTGSHAFRTGLTAQEGWHRHQYGMPGLLDGIVDYTFSNGKPLSLTQWAGPIELKERLKANIGLFVQDQWTIKRLTLNPGLRFDYFNSFIPEQHLAAGPFVPARDYPRLDHAPLWKDIEPRIGGAYDLLGDRKTALKVNLGRYVAADIFTTNRAMNPVQRSVISAGRTWTDNNGNFFPDCDLANPAEQTGIDDCGVINNLNFGKTDPRATTYANDVRTGWGHRNHNWQVSATLQRELRPGMAVNVGYFRTWYGSFWATDNQALTPADFDEFCVTAPKDARLPGGGGNRICGLYDVKPDQFGVFRNVVTQASNYGKQTEVYDGVDVTINARLQGGLQLSGGTNTGRTATNNCEVVMGRPQITFNSLNNITAPRTPAYCDVVTPWQTQVKFSGTYALPWDLRTSFTYQNLPGIPIYATYVARNAEIAPSLPQGRNLSSGASGTVTIDLIEPNALFEKRVTQLDIRISKSFRVRGRARLQGMFDIYNSLNASPILSNNSRFGTSWLTPTEILAGRLFKFGAELQF